MFLGEFIHTTDSKGRVFVPAKFRQELGETFAVGEWLRFFGPASLPEVACEFFAADLPLIAPRQSQHTFLMTLHGSSEDDAAEVGAEGGEVAAAG